MPCSYKTKTCVLNLSLPSTSPPQGTTTTTTTALASSLHPPLPSVLASSSTRPYTSIHLFLPLQISSSSRSVTLNRSVLDPPWSFYDQLEPHTSTPFPALWPVSPARDRTFHGISRRITIRARFHRPAILSPTTAATLTRTHQQWRISLRHSRESTRERSLQNHEELGGHLESNHVQGSLLGVLRR